MKFSKEQKASTEKTERSPERYCDWFQEAVDVLDQKAKEVQ